MKLSEKIDMFTGVISSGNTPALGPVAEELGLLTIFVDGCTDFLFDKAVPNPKYTFRITNIQSADGVTCALAAAQTWPTAKKIAHIHPDYSYGRNAFDHFMVAYKKLVPGAEAVSEAWPKLGTTDFTSHITKTISSNPDLIVSSVWGGDYVALYKQALRYGMFNNAKFASTIAFGVAPHAIGKDHPEGVIAGVHSNYYFTYPPGNRWPTNKTFVEKYFKRWNEYPNFQSDGAYHTLYMYKHGDREGEQAGRRLAGRGGDHQPARRHVFRDRGGLPLHPARQSPGLQGRGDRVLQERARVPVPDPRSEPDDHHPDPQYHGASGLAEARQRPQRSDRDLQLDQGNLAAGQLIVDPRGNALPPGRARKPAPRIAAAVRSMSVRKLPSPMRARGAVALAAAAMLGLAAAQAGHEVSYYPSFYPQEIRIEAARSANGRRRNSKAGPIRCTSIWARRRGSPAAHRLTSGRCSRSAR